MLYLNIVYSAILAISFTLATNVDARTFRTDPPKKQPAPVGEGGGLQGGGGDAIVEPRFTVIRTDLLKWIASGGSAALDLPAGVSHEEYVTKMNMIMAQNMVVIEATDEEVIVSGVSKTCKGFVSESDQRPHILCNTKRFVSAVETMQLLGSPDPETAQYQLVHHEYAGLVGLEKNNGASSDYSISVQMAANLENVVVKRLVVRQPTNSSPLIEFKFGTFMERPAIDQVIQGCTKDLAQKFHQTIFGESAKCTLGYEGRKAPTAGVVWDSDRRKCRSKQVFEWNSHGLPKIELYPYAWHPKTVLNVSVRRDGLAYMQVIVRNVEDYKNNPYISQKATGLAVKDMPRLEVGAKSIANLRRDDLGNIIHNPNPYPVTITVGQKLGRVERQGYVLPNLSYDTIEFAECLKKGIQAPSASAAIK